VRESAIGERALDEAFAEYAENQKEVAAERETVASGPQPEGRRARESHVNRAIAKRTVPHPIQIWRTELLASLRGMSQ
jgi:hypothetical protein